jgi:hypothetical protein
MPPFPQQAAKHKNSHFFNELIGIVNEKKNPVSTSCGEQTHRQIDGLGRVLLRADNRP